MELHKAPIAVAEMLIRKPAGEVYEAFVDPAVTTKFWFTDGSGRLDGGTEITWAWDMYGVSTPIEVKELVQAGRSWSNGTERPSTVEWTFTPTRAGKTFVERPQFRPQGRTDAQVVAAINSAGGFALVLAGAKAWLEHGIDARPDRATATRRAMMVRYGCGLRQTSVRIATLRLLPFCAAPAC